jgi:DNA-binding response OmpR family regulator
MRLLLADDDEASVRSLLRVLEHHGLSADTCGDGDAVVEAATRRDYVVFILDWKMPRRDGLSVCRELRARGVRSGIIMLTGHDCTEDVLAAFDAGVDDYVTKPCDTAVLLARIRALAHRTREVRAASLRAGPIVIDEREGVAYVGVQRLRLTRLEYLVLRCLARNAGEVVSHETLLREVWGIRRDGAASNVVQGTIKTLRQKLGHAASCIVGVRGEGYRLDPQSVRSSSSE